MKFKTISDATRVWVKGFNAIPQGLIEKAYFQNGFDDSFVELTPKTYQCDDCYKEYSESFAEENSYECECTVEDSDDVIHGNLSEKDFDSYLPMWGWLWTFSEQLDDDWVLKNLETVADCGFRVYESDELGVALGIDGAGYSFYEEHWIPLYKARGLRWHEEE